MQVLLLAIGSKGDVHPLAALGRVLKARGHRVLLATSAVYRNIADEEGFEFLELLSVEEHRKIESNPAIWDVRKSMVTFFRELVLHVMRRSYEMVSRLKQEGETVVVAPPFAIGARLANEKLGVPLVTIHLHLYLLRSAYQNRRSPLGNLPDWMPPAIKRSLFKIGDSLVDRFLGKELMAFRSELGLPPVSSFAATWWNSPDLMLGLFPEWYAPRQPDWPPQLRCVGFPLYVDPDTQQLPAEVEAFLQAGEPPIIFSPGSANNQARDFFAVSAEVCRRNGWRAILNTCYSEQVPQNLPDSIRVFAYVPFAPLFPRVKAVVHHGGIGTLAQALAAGVPHLVMPVGYDQPDNAFRLTQLGVGQTILPKHYKAQRVEQALRELTTSSVVARRCQEIASRLQGGPPLEEMCNLIEATARRKSVPAV